MKQFSSALLKLVFKWIPCSLQRSCARIVFKTTQPYLVASTAPKDSVQKLHSSTVLGKVAKTFKNRPYVLVYKVVA